MSEFPNESLIPDVSCLVEGQRTYFRTGATLSLDVRLDLLRKLYRAIADREQRIEEALLKDLGKGAAEGYLCEVGLVLSSLRYMIRHLRRFAKTKSVATPLLLFPSRSRILRRPYGVVLVMAPWNYPFLLMMDPVIGAVAAGNCCIVKPSPHSPSTNAIIREILAACFPIEHVAMVAGRRDENQALLNQHFDKIFFTGGVRVGREVLRKAAEHLTPTVLELGGKSPVVVTPSANLPLAARRIAFGKMLNCGQTCVAPDYVLVHRRVKQQLVDLLAKELPRTESALAQADGHMVRMVNRGHFDRVMGLIDPDKAVIGGTGDPETLSIAPTLLTDVSPEDPVMQEEIFGPVLPILIYDTLEEAMAFIMDRPTPLACYLFTEDRAEKKRFLTTVPFGGGCVNDTVIHLVNQRIPFGGLGMSGMGCYHGRYTFDCFSHDAGLVDTSTRIDLPLHYPPYSRWKMALARRVLR